MGTVSNFLSKDLPALLRLTGISPKRCPKYSDWYKRTELVLKQTEKYMSGIVHTSQISSAIDIVSADENMIERRSISDEAMTFFVNSSRNLYQDDRTKNKVTAARVKAFESKTLRTDTWADAVFECLSLHVVKRFETETGPVYLCDCKGFKVKGNYFFFGCFCCLACIILSLCLSDAYTLCLYTHNRKADGVALIPLQLCIRNK